MRRELPALLLIAWMPVWGAGSPHALDELLDQVRRERAVEQKHHAARERRFLEERDRRRDLLAEVKTEQARAAARADTLQQRYEANEAELAELDRQFSEQSGDLSEVFAVVREAAADAQGTFAASLVSAQLTERTAFMGALAARREAPTIDDLERLWWLILQDMTEAGKVARFDAAVIGAHGEEGPRRVTRIGSFNAVSEGRFLKFLPGTGKLMELSRQPPARLQSRALRLEQAGEGIHPVAVDPSRGAILGLMVRSPDLPERLRQGGWIGYVILVLGAVGLAIIMHRYVALGLAKRRVGRQLGEAQARENNPLGRLWKAVKERDHSSIESLTLRLDEALTHEASRLQRGLRTLAMLAAVAPLLGLLGTVTGIIETFQAITLFGTGDPKLMSGGISQALVTTQLGLGVAIPVLLFHSFLSGRVSRLVEALDQHASALLAQYAAEIGSR